MPEITPSKYLVTAGWDNAPHLDAKTKHDLLEATPPVSARRALEGYPQPWRWRDLPDPRE